MTNESNQFSHSGRERGGHLLFVLKADIVGLTSPSLARTTPAPRRTAAHGYHIGQLQTETCEIRPTLENRTHTSLINIRFFSTPSDDQPQVGNVTEVAVPFIKYTMRTKAEKRGDGSPGGHENKGKVQRTQAEKGLHLEQYDREFLFPPNDRNRVIPQLPSSSSRWGCSTPRRRRRRGVHARDPALVPCASLVRVCCTASCDIDVCVDEAHILLPRQIGKIVKKLRCRRFALTPNKTSMDVCM